MNYLKFHSSIKLKAFTLLELLVVMVLTIILTSVAFNAYLIVQQQYVQFKKTQNQALEYQTFNTLLIKDFQSEGLIKKEGRRLIFYKPETNVVYDFDKFKILRRNSIHSESPDIIPFGYNTLYTYFQSEVVHEGLVDSLVLSLTFFETDQQMIFKKIYSSEELIKGKSDEH